MRSIRLMTLINDIGGGKGVGVEKVGILNGSSTQSTSSNKMPEGLFCKLKSAVYHAHLLCPGLAIHIKKKGISKQS